MLVNIDRVHAYMQKYDLRAIVASSAVNTSYFTGYDCWMYRSFREAMTMPGGPNTLSQSYGVITENNRSPTLITNSYMTTFPVDEGVEVRPYGDFETDSITSTRSPLGAMAAFKRVLSKQKTSPSKALLSLLDERGITSGRIGVELGNLSRDTKTALEKLRKIEVLDCSELIRLIRMVKTTEEVSRLREAARITERAIVKSVGAAKQDDKMVAVSGVYRTELAKQGAALEHWSFGLDGVGLTDEGTVTLRKGAYLSHDVGCIYRMYYCDTGTTIVVGNQKDIVDTHRSLFQVIDENLDSLRAGTSPSPIMRNYANAYKRRGLKNVNYQLHGIGLETREHPVIAYSKFKTIADDIVSMSTEIPLEAGMVMNIETPLDFPGRGSFQVERTFLITNKGPKEVTPKRDGYPLIVD